MEFIKPNERYLDDYLSACQESYDNNIVEWMPVELDNFDNWKSSALHIYEMLESGLNLPVGVPRMHTYWCIENDKFIGEVQIRPYISAEEAKCIGHIGYAVRYSMWNKGFGTKILQYGVEKLRKYNVSPIYITCRIDNDSSNKVSTKVGFEFVDKCDVNGEEVNLYVLISNSDIMR